jgi:hypothetical protein
MRRRRWKRVLEKRVAGEGVPEGACVRKVVRMALRKGECTRGQFLEGLRRAGATRSVL